MLKNRQALSMVTIAIISFFIGTTFSIATLAKDSGSPFDKVWEAISDLQSKMETLEDRVQTLEEQLEELRILSHNWGANNVNITFTARNTGSVVLIIFEISVNDEPATMTLARLTLQPSETETVVVSIASGFVSGTKYEFEMFTIGGKKYSYTTTAP